MGAVWTIHLELIPVGKGRPRMTKRGHVYTPEKTREFEESVKKLARAQYWLKPLEGPVRASIRFFMPMPKRPKTNLWHVGKPDLDNAAKAVFDSLNGIVWEDDSQVCEVFMTKHYAKIGTAPRIILEVQSIDSLE